MAERVGDGKLIFKSQSVVKRSRPKVGIASNRRSARRGEYVPGR